MASDGAAKNDSAPVPPSWAANHFKQTKGDRSITFVQSRLPPDDLDISACRLSQVL